MKTIKTQVDIQKVKSLMVRENVTRDEMCKIMGVKKDALNQRLIGRVDFKAKELIRICNFFNVKMDELVK